MKKPVKIASFANASAEGIQSYELGAPCRWWVFNQSFPTPNGKFLPPAETAYVEACGPIEAISRLRYACTNLGVHLDDFNEGWLRFKPYALDDGELPPNTEACVPLFLEESE